MTEVRVLASPGDVADAAARIFTEAAARAVADHGRFTVALSGGRTPAALYRLLAGDGRTASRAPVPWDRVHVFWSDERHVPPTHADSNFRMASEALLDHVPIPPDQIHRVHAEDPAAAQAASDYERTLRDVFGLADRQSPMFDLMLLGMGADGHTASLFPGASTPPDAQRLVAAPWVAQAASHRITLTPLVLTGAAHVVVLVTGADKAAALHAVLEGPADVDRFPAQCLRDASHAVTWLVDQAAAARLSSVTGPSA